MASPRPPASTGGFKLKLKVGGADLSALSAAPPAQPPTAVAPAALYAHPPPAAAAPHSVFGGEAAQYGHQAGAAYYPQAGAHDEDDDGEEKVPASKYRKLKRKYLEAVEARDDTSLALFRAQKLIHRLREDKSSLLDRVVQLEVTAGLTSHDVSLTRDETLRSERELAFPLLHPPIEPSLADRPQKLPVIRTDMDLSNPNYNKPLGPAPLPQTFPPRQRSHHLRTALAAQKLRDEHDAKRAAYGLSRPAFPAVAVLGLEGSTVALNVERALAGEAFDPAGEAPARGSKRRRESSSGAGRGKSRATSASASAPAPTPAPVYAAAPAPEINNLPNPFAAIGASIPVGETFARNNADALAAASASPAPAAATPQPLAPSSGPAAATYEEDASMLDNSDDGFGAAEEEDDGGAYKPAPSRRAAGRKSGAEGGGMKPKKVRAHGLTSGTHKIPPIPRNADGTPRLEDINVGILMLRNLGTVDPRTNFITERYIFPVGYEASRRYASMVDPHDSADYLCRVVDGGDAAPRFELHPSDQPGVVISTGTPTGAWSTVVKAANKIRNKQHSGSVSGPDMFGFSHNVVKALIQELPGASAVKGYVSQTYVEDPSAVPYGGSQSKKAATTSRRRSGRGGPSEETSPAPEPEQENIDVEVNADGDGAVYSGDYTVDQGEYAIPTGGYGEQIPDDSFGPASLQHLLAAAGADPYAIPGEAAPLDPFLAVTAAANAATPVFDPYAIPPAQPMIDPAFGDFQTANSFAYGIPEAQ
ncbi:hypothetical protein JCM10213_002846 [Rhodosporidiobolus nylandii]